MIEFIITIISILIGYVLGRFTKPEQEIINTVEKMGKTVVDNFKDKPKPGVVNHLTPEQIEEKHDPKKRGNREAFDKLFREYPPGNIL